MQKEKKGIKIIENRKEENSEAGNRTPVVRVTGGNTKPLYYFGSVIEFKVSPIRIRLNIPIFLQMSSRIKNNFSQRNYCHMCMSTDKLSIMCDNVVECKSSVSHMQVGDIPCNRMFCCDCVKKFFKEDVKQLVLLDNCTFM